jgi:hypothetical protein
MYFIFLSSNDNSFFGTSDCYQLFYSVSGNAKSIVRTVPLTNSNLIILITKNIICQENLFPWNTSLQTLFTSKASHQANYLLNNISTAVSNRTSSSTNRKFSALLRTFSVFSLSSRIVWKESHICNGLW